jgi:hypothetical protein
MVGETQMMVGETQMSMEIVQRLLRRKVPVIFTSYMYGLTSLNVALKSEWSRKRDMALEMDAQVAKKVVAQGNKTSQQPSVVTRARATQLSDASAQDKLDRKVSRKKKSDVGPSRKGST